MTGIDQICPISTLWWRGWTRTSWMKPNSRLWENLARIYMLTVTISGLPNHILWFTVWHRCEPCCTMEGRKSNKNGRRHTADQDVFWRAIAKVVKLLVERRRIFKAQRVTSVVHDIGLYVRKTWKVIKCSTKIHLPFWGLLLFMELRWCPKAPLSIIARDTSRQYPLYRSKLSGLRAREVVPNGELNKWSPVIFPSSLQTQNVNCSNQSHREQVLWLYWVRYI